MVPITCFFLFCCCFEMWRRGQALGSKNQRGEQVGSAFPHIKTLENMKVETAPPTPKSILPHHCWTDQRKYEEKVKTPSHLYHTNAIRTLLDTRHLERKAEEKAEAPPPPKSILPHHFSSKKRWGEGRKLETPTPPQSILPHQCHQDFAELKTFVKERWGEGSYWRELLWRGK